MDEKDHNKLHRSLQVSGDCNALWHQGRIIDSTIYSSDSYYNCVGCSSPALEVHHKSTSKKEIRGPSCISEENAIYPCRQDSGNGEGGGSLSNYDKSHTFHSRDENQELLFRGITSGQVWSNERREKTGIWKGQGSIKGESKDDGINIFNCPNQGKIEGLQTLLGPMLRVGILEGSSWKENYPKTPCYFVFPDSRPKWGSSASMFPVSIDNKLDSSGNNPSVVLDMFANESDRNRIANSLDIEIQNGDLQKDNIRLYAKEIALCGFNHIIVVGKTYCGLLFLDCYGRVFRWDAMTGALVFFGDFSKAVSEKSSGVLWGVSGDGSVWELSDLDSPEECNSHPVSDKKKSKKKGKNKNQKKRH